MDLAPYTTFGVHAECDNLVTVHTVDELKLALRQHPSAHILGGGSNILLTGKISGTVIRVAIEGREENNSIVTFGAGENWHDMVTWCVDRDLGGLENLALIPGTVGAAPMQNIGAYGVEQRSRFVELKAVERSTGNVRLFAPEECEFGYRTSVFKRSLKDQYVIVSASYRLDVELHELVTSYEDVAKALSARQAPLTIRDVYDVVVDIRMNKLPDPALIGNAGSFFKNPVVTAEKFESIRSKFPDVRHYLQPDGTEKIAAAWMIDQCGWKGHREGDAGVHSNQPLVLVNFGDATGSQIYDLSEKIQTSVLERFGVTLEREVNVWGESPDN